MRQLPFAVAFTPILAACSLINSFELVTEVDGGDQLDSGSDPGTDAGREDSGAVDADVDAGPATVDAGRDGGVVDGGDGGTHVPTCVGQAFDPPMPVNTGISTRDAIYYARRSPR